MVDRYGQRMRAAFDAYPVDLSGRWRRRPGQVLDVTLLVCALSQTWVGQGKARDCHGRDVPAGRAIVG